MVDLDPYNGYPVSRSVADFGDIDYEHYGMGVKPNRSYIRSRSYVINNSLNAYNYKIIESKQIGHFLVVKVQYPNSPHYEGVKVLVFEGIDIETLMKQKCIDPHFSESPKMHHPVARFLPTTQGWSNALRFCEMLNSEQVFTYSF